jgi:hypothetical protein
VVSVRCGVLCHVTGRGLYVEIQVRGSLDELWQRTQDPVQHARWDLRFSEIEHLQSPPGQPQQFRYAVRLPGRTIAGIGVSVGERSLADGGMTSALRFSSPDPWSPIRSGSGYWRYVPTPGGVRFLTGYDYEPGPQGAWCDRVLVRPFVGWMTAWSFDRLRLWVETGLVPEASARRSVAVGLTRAVGVVAASWLAPAPLSILLVAAVVVIPVPVARPLARRCRRRPPDRLGARPPSTLADLADPIESAHS